MRKLFFLTINVSNIHCISNKDYILLINTLPQICIITNSSPVITISCCINDDDNVIFLH